MIGSKPEDTQSGKHFTVFHTAAEEGAKSDEEHCAAEGGHMSSERGRIVHAPGSAMPYKVILTHDAGDDSERAFATMREAESFIQRNTPVPAARRTTYDRSASEVQASSTHTESNVRDEAILARLKVIDRRLREISIEQAASVLAQGLNSAGIDEKERLRLVAETERILDEIDGKNDG